MATNQELIESINDQVATINKGASKAGLQTLTPLSPITPQAISENPTPIDVVPPPVPQTIEAFQGQVAQPQADQIPQSFADQQTQKVEQFGSDAEQNFESYIMAQLQAPTFSEVTAQQYEQQGVDRLQKKVNQYDLQIVDEQRRLRREQAQIRENRQGLFGGAMQSRLLEASRKSIEQQADLGMLRAFAQNDYLAAKTTADRAIDAITDQNQKFVDALKANYERSQDLFTTAQSREFQVKLADYERQQNKAISDAKLLQETKLQAMQMAQANNAPQSVFEVIVSSETPEEVIANAGQWGNVDMLERAIKSEQLAQLRNKPEVLRSTQVIDQGGRKLLIDSQTGEVIQDFGITDTAVGDMQKAVQQEQIAQIDDIKSHKGFNSSVGPVKGTRIGILDTFSGAKDDFIASVDNLTKDMTLQALIDAKANGATFGALSEGELRLLSESASKINNWRRTRDDGSTKYYDASEKDFMAELDRISNYAKLDAILKGAEPNSVGVTQLSDGSYWTKDGNGNFVQIK